MKWHILTNNGRPRGRGLLELAAAAVLALPLASGCGQESPPTEPPSGDFDPLAVGSWWDYSHGDWTEHVELSATTHEGQDAFLLSGSPDPDDNLRSDSILVKRDGRILRVARNEYAVDPASGAESLAASVTYGVGFLRFSEAWPLAEIGFTESPEYVRIETPAGGSARPPEDRRHTFEIISVSAEITTPAGTFSDCVVVRRTKDWEALDNGTDASDAQTKTYWFARGVGKVQERNDETGRIEALSEYEIAR